MTGSQYDLKHSINDFNKRKEKLQLDAKNGNLTEEQYNDAVEGLSSEAQRLDIATKNVAATQKKMDALAGVYVTEKAKSGGFFGNFTNSLLVSIDELISSDGLSGKKQRQQDEIEIKSQDITPQQRQYYKDKGYNDEQIKNVFINNAQKNAIAANKRAIIETFGSDLTTEESKQNLGFVEQALVGVAASLPSMALSLIPVVGQAAAFGGMANMSYNAINEMMLNDADFETTSEADRAIVAIPYAIVMGALEKVGMNKMLKGESTIGKIVLSRIAKIIPKGATREVIENIANKEVKSLVAKGALKVIGGTLAEAETGALQAGLLDFGLLSLFNALDPLDLKLTNKEGLTGGEAFETPDTKAGVAMSILEGSAAEAIGGFAMSTVMVGSQGLINGKISLYNKEDLKFFEDFSSDQEFKKLIVSNLKTQMLNGTMTKGEAQSALNDIDLVEGVFNSIDENLPEMAKLTAFNLINERNRLEKEKQGKDPALSKVITDRINEINDKLAALPKQVQRDNNTNRINELESALKQRKNKAGTITIEGKKIPRTEVETELKQLNQKLKDAIQEQTAGQVPVQPTTAVGEEVVQGEPTAESQGLTEEGKAEEVAPLTIQEELQLLAEEQAEAPKAPVVEAPTLEAPVIEAPIVEAPTLETPVVEVEATPQEKVATYRAEEQAELLKAIPKIESYKVKGKIDKTKMPKTVLAKYNKIYEKYDALISPLLEPVVKAPVVKAEAPKAKGELPVMSWSKVEEYDDAVIRSMKEIQYGKLKPLLDLGKRTTVAQKEEIRTIEAKIATAEKILDRRANKIKKEAQRVEKEGKGATVRAVDNNGTEAEYSVVVSKDGATAKVQLKKIGTLTPKRASVEANLTIETDEKRGRFVITKNKTKVYIDEAITPAKVETTKTKVASKAKVEPVVEETEAESYSSLQNKNEEAANTLNEIEKQIVKHYKDKGVSQNIIDELILFGDKSVTEFSDIMPEVANAYDNSIEDLHKKLDEATNNLKAIEEKQQSKIINDITKSFKDLGVKETGLKSIADFFNTLLNYSGFDTFAKKLRSNDFKDLKKDLVFKTYKAIAPNEFMFEVDRYEDVPENIRTYIEDTVDKAMQRFKEMLVSQEEQVQVKEPQVLIEEAKAEPVKEEAKVAPVVEEVVEVEQYQPITIEKIFNDRFSKENAISYDEEERETDNGRMSTYISSITMDVTNEDGDSIGTLTKLVDEDRIITWNGEDFDGNQLSEQDFDFKDDARQAIVDKWNKEQKKNFDREAKKKNKDAQKAKEKADKAAAKEEAKSASVVKKEEAPAPEKKSTDDLMGAIDSIKEDIEDTTKEIEDARKVAREKINKIREEILDLKESKGKEGTIMDLEADIKEIQDDLKKDLDGLKLDLDRHVQALKEEVKKLGDLDAKAPENKKTLLSYLDAAIKTLNGLNSNNLLNVKVDAGFTITKWVTVGVLKKILQGIRLGVIAGNTINASIRAMAKEYRGEHKNKKITIAEFTKEIEEYLRNTFVDQKTNEQDIQETRAKFVEIREAVRKAKVAVKTKSKALRANAFDAIQEMLKGKVKKLSAVQMKSIMLRLARFNVFSQTQYDKFIDYVDKVIGIADYDAKVNEANKNRKTAKKNTIGDKPKLGDITPDLFRSLSIMLNIDAKLIPSDVFESYYKIVDMLSKRDTVLQLEQRSFLNENVDKIIASIELNDEKISDLKELYDNFEKVKEDGKVDYSGTLAKMLKDDVINQDEYELMKTFKSKIVEAKVKDKMTEQEIADEKAELIDEVNNTTITLDEIVGDEFRLERELAKRLQVLLKQTDLKNLNNKDLKKLLIIIDNINNGFVSNATQLMVEKLNSTKKSIPLATSVHAKITSLYNKMNRFISKTFSRDEFRIAVAPLNLIDEQFGDFQTKNIYNSVFKDSAKAQQAFEAEISKIRAELTEIEKSLDKFFDKDHNKKVASKIKMMIYMLQIEKNSNPNSNKVHNAIDILDATIKFSKENSKKSKNSKADLKVLESIRENFVKDEQIDMDELFNSFGAQEKNALKKLQEINNSMTKKAAYTATVINGNKITTFDNYIFHNTISVSDDMSVDALVNNISDNMQPTTKSKNLEERGDKALAMNLNPFLAVTVSSRSVLLNYHLTEPIRTARKTLIDTIKLLDAEKANGEKNKMTSEERKDFEAATKEQYDILNAIKDAYETATKDLLTSNFTESKQWIDWISRQGYRAVLASAPRAVAEITSNALFVLSAFPKEITIGFNDTFSLSNSSDAKNILESLGSSLISRLYSEDSLSSVWLDTSAFANRISRDGKMKPKMVNGVLKFHDKYTGRWVDAVSFMADNLIAKPDQAIMRPLWFGSFVNSFKNKTGVEPDFNKIKENDEAYMDKYRGVLEEARDVADNNADLTGGNMNPYMSSLQNVIRKEDSFPKVWLKTFQKYMNKFTVKEYYTARKGVRALVGDGDITQKQGALILTGVALRMTMYTTVTRLLSEFIMYSFGLGDDDDEEDDDYNAKHIGRKLYQGFTSMLTTLILGRRFGNVVRMAENYFIEWANETYGEDIGLRNGEYDPYEDAVQFNQLQDGKIDKTTDLVKVIAGPYAPAVGFSDLVIKKARELRAPEAKTERARITRAKEWGRLGLETTGFLGIMPLYKDVRKVFMGYTYKELKKETKETAVKKDAQAKTDAEEIVQKTSILKQMMNSGAYTREGIKKELRKIKDPEYRKAEKKIEDDMLKSILDKTKYSSRTDFEKREKENAKNAFKMYDKKREESLKINRELTNRMDALEYGEQYVPKKKKSSGTFGGGDSFGGSSSFGGSDSFGGGDSFGESDSFGGGN